MTKSYFVLVGVERSESIVLQICVEFCGLLKADRSALLLLRDTP